MRQGPPKLSDLRMSPIRDHVNKCKHNCALAAATKVTATTTDLRPWRSVAVLMPRGGRQGVTKVTAKELSLE